MEDANFAGWKNISNCIFKNIQCSTVSAGVRGRSYKFIGAKLEKLPDCKTENISIVYPKIFDVPEYQHEPIAAARNSSEQN